MWIKAHEDPLYQICREEQAARRKILDNPLKLKEIQNRMRDQNSKQKELAEDKETDDLVNQYLALIEKKNKAKELNKATKVKYSNDKSSKSKTMSSFSIISHRMHEMQKHTAVLIHRAGNITKYHDGWMPMLINLKSERHCLWLTQNSL